MVLNNISLTNFRNHRQFELELPDPSVPLYISGLNGAGKTSVAEAIYLLFTLRTFRQQPLSDIKTFNEDFMRVKGEFAPSDTIRDAVIFYRNERKFMINGSTDFMPIAEYSHITPVISYSPSFETLLSSEHSERRQSLDRIIFYLDKTHLNRVKKYNSLMQRKRAELDKDFPDRQVLQIINEQLIPVSKAVSDARSKLVENINDSVKSIPEAVELLMPDIELVLSVNSMEGRDFNVEIERHRPTCGAHKDLLYVKKNGKIIEKFQSFGQKKSCLLLFLYHLAIEIGTVRDSDILIIFDDFEAGLDGKRSGMLNELIKSIQIGRNHRQIILTGISNKHHPSALTVELS